VWLCPLEYLSLSLGYPIIGSEIDADKMKAPIYEGAHKMGL